MLIEQIEYLKEENKAKNLIIPSLNQCNVFNSTTTYNSNNNNNNNNNNNDNNDNNNNTNNDNENNNNLHKSNSNLPNTSGNNDINISSKITIITFLVLKASLIIIIKIMTIYI